VHDAKPVSVTNCAAYFEGTKRKQREVDVSYNGWVQMRKPFAGRRPMMTVVQWVRWTSEVGKTATKIAGVAGIGVMVNGAFVQPSTAQIAALPQPEYTLKDENNVDLLSFYFYLQQTDLSIGSKEQPLAHTLLSGGNGGWLGSVNASGGGTVTVFGAVDSLGVNNFFATGVWASGAYPAACPAASGTVPFVTVRFAGASETFATTLPGCGSYSTVDPTGNTLTLSTANSTYTYTYTKRDGTKIILYCGTTEGSEATCTQLQQIQYPDGRVLTYWYTSDGLTQSVTRNDGLQLKYTWSQASGAWTLASLTAINNAVEYCAPTARTCSLTKNWPTATYAITTPSAGALAFTVTDAAGRVTRYTSYGTTSYGIKQPSSPTADNITYTFCGTSSNWCSNFASEYAGLGGYPYEYYVTSVIRDGQTWTYTGAPGSPGYYTCGTATYGFTNPVGNGKHASLTNCEPNMYPASAPRPGFYPLIQLTDEDGVVFQANNSPLIATATKLEGNQTQYSWDANGNLPQEVLVPKSGSPLAKVPLAANYLWAGCTPVNCNKPHWVKDGMGNETDYIYDPTHGGVLTATLPADANGIRPQARRTYTQRYAWVLNASGAYVQSAAPIWVLATESSCRTSTASTTGTGCTVAGDEVVKTYEYGPNAGPNNLFLRGVAVTADAVTHRTCYGYDPYGNKISETEAAAGLTSCP